MEEMYVITEEKRQELLFFMLDIVLNDTGDRAAEAEEWFRFFRSPENRLRVAEQEWDGETV